MKVQGLIEELLKIPKDWEVNLSTVMVIDKKDKISAVVDFPFKGIAKNKEDKEVRFCIQSDDTTLDNLLGKFIIRVKSQRNQRKRRNR